MTSEVRDDKKKSGVKIDESRNEHYSADEDAEITDDELVTSRQFNKFQFLDPEEIEEVDIGDDQLNEGNNTNQSDEEDSKGSDQKAKALKPSANTANKQRKRKNKKKKSHNNKEADLDIDLLNQPDSKCDNSFVVDDEKTATSTTSLIDKSQAYSLLKIDLRNLIPENELKRMFGKSVLKEEKSKEAKFKHHHMLASSNSQRSRFVSSAYHDVKLAQQHNSGPRMDIDTLFESPKEIRAGAKRNNPVSSDCIFFRFIHEKSYQQVHMDFLEFAHRGFSEGIVHNLQHYPTHVESLLQLSDMIRISEDYKAASELVERALFIFERGFHPRFNMTQANCRLSYKRPENRTFFITLFKHINYLNRRGLRKTPLEYTKLLLSLDPINDPLFATLQIDFFAIRSEEYDYLIEFISKWPHLAKLPNINFSLALAYFMKSCNKKLSKSVNEENLKLADEQLQKALIRYPNFIIPLLDACIAEPSSELKKCDYFDYSVYSNKYKTVPESIELLVSIYVQRNCNIWKTKNVLSWLERNVAFLVDQFSNKKLKDEGQQIEYWKGFQGPAPKNLLRHIVLSDLKIKIPPSASNVTVFDIDPFPPTSIFSYKIDGDRISGNSTRTSTTTASQTIGEDLLSTLRYPSLFIRSMLPSFSSSDVQEQSSSTISTQSSATNAESSTSGNNTTSQSQDLIQQQEVLTAELERAMVQGDGGRLNLDPIQNSILSVLTSLSHLLAGSETRADHQSGPPADDQQRDNQRND